MKLDSIELLSFIKNHPDFILKKLKKFLMNLYLKQQKISIIQEKSVQILPYHQR